MMALGTNDLSAPPEDVAGWLQQARALVGARRLIWVNLRLDTSRSDDWARYVEINTALAANAHTYGVELVDWDSWARDHGIANGPDGVHYDEANSRRRARFYVDVVARRIATV